MDGVLEGADQSQTDAPGRGAGEPPPGTMDKRDPDAWLARADALVAEGGALNMVAAAEALGRALELRSDAAIWNRLKATIEAADEARGLQPPNGRLILPTPDYAKFYVVMSDFCLRHRRAKAVPRLAAVGLRRFPETIELHRCWLDALEALDQQGRAAEALDFAPTLAAETATRQAKLLRRGIAMLRRAGELERELELMERLAELVPEDHLPKVRLRARAWQAGLDERAEAYNLRLQQHYADRLPTDLRQALDDLWRSAPQAPLSEPAVQRAWALADQSRWSFEEWRLGVQWGALARQMLIEWFLANPDGGAQLAALSQPTDLSMFDPVRKGPIAGIIAGVHLGPVVPIFELLRSEEAPFRYLSATLAEQVDGSSKMVINSAAPTTRVLRDLIDDLRRPGLIGLAVDAPARGDRVEVQLAGGSVQLSNLPARMAMRYGCPTYWCIALWRADRVVFDMARLPDPLAEEAEADFIGRWMAALTDRLEPVLRGDPRNLLLTGRLWRALSA